MKKFEVGKSYAAHSACDYDCVFLVKVLSRTDKTLVFSSLDGGRRRTKIHADADGSEWICPDRYSMAPVYRAVRDEIEEA